MRTNRYLSMASAVAVAAGLAACAAPDPYGPNNYPVSAPNTTYVVPGQPVAAVEYGHITNVQLVSGAPVANPNRGAAGSVIGGIVGGLLGNTIGAGSGRAAATVLGAVGGAVVGNHLAQRDANNYAAGQAVYRVTVQTDTGAMRSYDVAANADLRVGDRVRIENGVIYLA
jgi:outer membrane lipoprotein SlyB